MGQGLGSLAISQPCQLLHLGGGRGWGAEMPHLMLRLVWGRVQSPRGYEGDAPSSRLTVFCLVQDVQDVRQLQRQLVRLLGHVRVHTLDLGAVCREGRETARPYHRVTALPPTQQPLDTARPFARWALPVPQQPKRGHLTGEGTWLQENEVKIAGGSEKTICG